MKNLEMILVALNEKKGKFISLKEIMKFVKLTDNTSDEKDILVYLEYLESLKIIEKVEYNRYKKLLNNNMILGRFYYSPKGKGHGIGASLVSNKENRETYFIDRKDINKALHEDYVVLRIQEKGEKRLQDAQVVKIIQRNNTSIVGTVILDDASRLKFISDNNKYPLEFSIDEINSKKAEVYDRVIAKVLNDMNEKPFVRITDVLGFKLQKESILEKIIEQHELKKDFPIKVLQQAEKLENGVTPDELNRRTDYRAECIFTIDGEDAKDLDDAVSIKLLDNGNYLLGVYIADVAHYVREGSKIDKEAYERGTSVYLVDTVLPMLPERLSNGLCSLTPHTDKLTLNVLMEITPDGETVNSLFEESVIRSVSRLHYGDVTRFLNGQYDEYVQKEGTDVTDSLKLMHELALILMEKRDKRGTIDFDFPEAKIKMNGESVEAVVPYERGIGNQIIEEFMIVCNETVSEFFNRQAIPFVYRIHEKPSEDRVEGLRNFLEKMNYTLPDVEEIKPIHLQKILKSVEGQENEKALQLLILQVMKQARYSDEAKGHFGLAADYYSHFTSPIRRYPDLMIHRILKSYINKSLTAHAIEELSETLKEKTKSCSKKERIAERAENELRQNYKVEYMIPFVGEEFEATITSMSNGGFSLILPNTVEGFVPLSTIGLNAKYDDENHSIQADNLKLVLGQKIKVQLIKAKLETKEIIFKFVSLT